MAMMCDKILGMEDEITNVDFTSDCPGFWEAYENCLKNHIDTIDGKAEHNKVIWEKFVDPDAKSEKLKENHENAWLKRFKRKHSTDKVLVFKKPDDVKENEIRISSDTIFTSFIGYDYGCNDLFKKVLETFGGEHNYRCYIEGYTREFYRNIGGFTVFPLTGRKNDTFNTVRGRCLADRFDLALECIRLYYKNKKDENKLTKQEKGFIERHKDLFTKLFEVVDKDSHKINQDFFDLFRDFKGYVDFFCFQDWVSDDYAHVKDLMRGGFLDDDGNISFEHPFPQTVTEYEQWMENQLKLVKARTQRINQAITEN